MLERMVFSGPMFFMTICSLALVTAFCGIYERKKSCVRQMFLAAVLLVGILLLDDAFVDFENASTSLEAPLYFLGAFLFGTAIYKIPRRAALYCTVLVYLVTDALAQIVMPVSDIFYRIQPPVRYVWILLVYLACTALCCILTKKFLVGRFAENGRYHVGRQKLLFSMFILVVYAVLSNYQVLFWLLGYEPESGSNMITVFRLIMAVFCFTMLYLQNRVEQIQRTEQELDTIRQLWHQQQEQYLMSKENIELINRKCHDLRHQIAALRALHDEQALHEQIDEMEKSIMIYDTAMKTGNPVLDTVLTEKSLFCEEHAIQMTCMADGTALDFVGSVDLYTMFGNALDNAIETVMQYKDRQKRVIQVSVFPKGNFQMIRVRNYCETKPAFEDGLPVSTKADRDYHGYGLKSIRYTAEKYGGGITCVAGEDYFSLQILLPVPADSAAASV